MKTLLLYLGIAALTALSYITIYDLVIAQEPYEKQVIISNLTLNYVLFALLVGAFVPTYIKRRYFAKAPKYYVAPIALVVGILLIVVLRMLGMEMRF